MMQNDSFLKLALVTVRSLVMGMNGRSWPGLCVFVYFLGDEESQISSTAF
jgi:hypothetical protein